VRLLLDVDTGVDDALALAFAVGHPDIQLEAVIATAGNVGLVHTTRNTLRVLDWLGATDVPVAAGAAEPISGVIREASWLHGKEGLGGARLPDSMRQAVPDGIGYLIDALLQAPQALTVVCTGPLTDLGLAVRRQPEIVDAVRRVVVMGGAARVPGNITPVAEFNIYADPHAAAIVFGLPWPVTMVGLDVTTRVALTRTDRDALLEPYSREAMLVREVTRDLFETNAFEAIFLHDPLAVQVAVAPDLVRSIDRQVLVETRGEHTLGQTVVDLRPHAVAYPATNVCLDVDVPRARSLFLRTLGLRLEP
jgi:purine nucleosidase